MQPSIITVNNSKKSDFDMKFYTINEKRAKYFGKMCEMSFEYKKLLFYLKNTLDVNRCSFYEGYTLKNGFKLEFHHNPLTIFEYCETIMYKQYEENKGYVKTSEVCDEVMRCHYAFEVGLVPLNPTAHELYHSGNLPIHPDLSIGNWEEFCKKYEKYMTEELKAKVRDVKMEKNKENPKEYPKILQRSELYLNIPDIKKPTTKMIERILAHESVKRLESFIK